MKVAVVYASTTGNTEAMANAVCEGLQSDGVDLVFSKADSTDVSALSSCDVILLGSPAMGDEVLEDSMEEFYAKAESSLGGKKVGLFGSYDWGDGQWLRDWADRVSAAGASLCGESLMVNLAPDEEGLAKCREWAKACIQ